MAILDFSAKDEIDKKNVAWEGRSLQIVSLLDMLRVYAAHFIQVSNLLADLRGIIKTLDLLKPIYQKTAAYGHFGREEFSWEKTDKAAALKKDAGI